MLAIWPCRQKATCLCPVTPTMTRFIPSMWKASPLWERYSYHKAAKAKHSCVPLLQYVFLPRAVRPRECSSHAMSRLCIDNALRISSCNSLRKIRLGVVCFVRMVCWHGEPPHIASRTLPEPSTPNTVCKDRNVACKRRSVPCITKPLKRTTRVRLHPVLL